MLGLFKSKKKTERAKILIVDDQPDLVDTIQRRLEYFNWDVITASNGKEGLENAESEKPDLILLDIDMPVMNGHEMLRHLRMNSTLKNTPVIMCTISDNLQDITMASSNNICDYVTKPFNCTELVEKVTTALKSRNDKKGGLRLFGQILEKYNDK
jgi:DNA-binding response OmpR family regulator